MAEGQRGQQGEVARSFVQLANQLRSTMGRLGEPWGTMGNHVMMLGYVVPKLAVNLSNLTKIVLKKRFSVANRTHLLLQIDSQC